MISVEEAVARITSAFSPLEVETVAVGAADGRVLAQDLLAKHDQPPFPVSSMDGYAVRATDASRPGARLKVIGAAPAGHPFLAKVGTNQTVRIFTGGVVPDGADSIVIQEDVVEENGDVKLNVAATSGRHIRIAGLDFRSGEVLARQGQRLAARDLALIAAGDLGFVVVRRKPRIVIAATGDELSPPGTERRTGGIVASSGYALGAMIERWGGIPIDLGILPDTQEAIASIADHARSADIVVTIGGASVGEHDLVQKALGPRGFELDFWKIAMRPGKPLIFGRLGATPLLGLPGNPVSSLVCAMLFLQPAIATLLGTPSFDNRMTGRLLTDLNTNDSRQDYLRARLDRRNGEQFVEPFAVQDSSMLTLFARADALIVRPPHAPAAKAGDRVSILLLD
jgi:molybdopterin molybdotransferase